jgi:hypothetical protein
MVTSAAQRLRNCRHQSLDIDQMLFVFCCTNPLPSATPSHVKDFSDQLSFTWSKQLVQTDWMKRNTMKGSVRSNFITSGSLRSKCEGVNIIKIYILKDSTEKIGAHVSCLDYRLLLSQRKSSSISR